MTMILKLFFAGLWQMVWHWGIGTVLAILCTIAAVWSPVGKKFFAASAVVIFAFLVGMGVGIYDEKTRTKAKEAVIDKTITDILKETDTPAAKQRPDRWDTDE